MTLFTTILAGVSVFVFGQIVLKWMIEPTQELRKVISEVLFYLANDYPTIQNAHTVDKQHALAVGANLEKLGASLLASQHLIPFYGIVRWLCRLPDREQVARASKRLGLISKSMFGTGDDIHYRLDLYRKDVCDALAIMDPIQGGMTRQELQESIRQIQNQSRV